MNQVIYLWKQIQNSTMMILLMRQLH